MRVVPELIGLVPWPAASMWNTGTGREPTALEQALLARSSTTCLCTAAPSLRTMQRDEKLFLDELIVARDARRFDNLPHMANDYSVERTNRFDHEHTDETIDLGV